MDETPILIFPEAHKSLIEYKIRLLSLAIKWYQNAIILLKNLRQNVSQIGDLTKCPSCRSRPMQVVPSKYVTLNNTIYNWKTPIDTPNFPHQRSVLQIVLLEEFF